MDTKNKSIMNTLELEAYNAPYQIGVKEARKQLQDSEKRFDEGEYVSEEEMEEFYNALQ